MEIILRILEFFESLMKPQHAGREEKNDLTPIIPDASKDAPEALALILTKDPNARDTLARRCLEYVNEMERIRAERFTRDYGYIRDARGYIPLGLINTYNKVMDDIYTQTTYEFLILTKLIGEGHIDFGKHAEEMRKGWHRFDKGLYREACREICNHYKEVVGDLKT